MRPHSQSSPTRGGGAAAGQIALLVVAALGLILVGVWGIAKLGEEDWFIGGGFIACSVIGLGRVLARIAETVRLR